MEIMISIFGSSGFIGSRYSTIYKDVFKIDRNDRKPKSNDILYFISTVDNYNIYENISLDVETNLNVLCEVLNHCRSNKITFNFISSWFVYGKTHQLPAKESQTCNPTGFYSITKKCAEDLIISFANTYGMKYRILRLCNVLGKNDNKCSKKKNAITWMIKEIKKNNDITLYDQGTHKREIIHVDDACRAINLIIQKSSKNEIYNIGTGKATAINDIMVLAKKFTKSKSKFKNIKTPEFHKSVQARDFWMNNSKLSYLGFQEQINLETMIKELCQ
tara:strand:- start:2022 stop:2846 length:825 start_codon:yes stop_codon:yes gene_type:complete